MVKKYNGNIGMVFFVMVIIMVLSMQSLFMLDVKMSSIKRQNIHNAVASADLASYVAIEQGDKDIVLPYIAKDLEKYLNNPNKIIDDNIEMSDIVNFMTSEYIKPGERYKSIYLRPNKTYNYFDEYIKKDLNLVSESKYVYVPDESLNNKGDIVKLTIQDFKVYNAIYKNMTPSKIPIEIPNENRTYTGIHLVLNAVVNTSSNTNNIKTVNIPMHIDTEITLYRPVIN